MKFIDNIDKSKFDEFVLKHSNISFMQSSTWGEFENKTINRKDYYLGLVDDKDNIVCAGMFLKKELLLGYSYLYCPRGFIIDYKNKELLKEYTDELYNYCKSKKILFIKIDPEVKLHDLDIDGNVIGNDNTEIVEYLKKIGYKHFGYNKNFENSLPRYTFRLKIDKSIEDIINNFHPTTKKIIKKGNVDNLIILKNKDASIDDFYYTMKETEKRENILYHSKSYYEDYYKLLSKKNMSDLFEIKVDWKELLNLYKDRKEKVTKEITELEQKEFKRTDKKNNLLKELNNQLTKINKEISNIEESMDKEPVLSSILTTKFGDTVWTVHGGNSTYLREANANYFVYYEVIKDAVKEGYKYVDFFGTTGDNSNTNNSVYGIHSFKKRLGGEYIEYIGEFDLIINKFMYKTFNILIPIYRKVQRIKNKSKR